MAEHTPGPWHLQELPYDDAFRISGESTLHLTVTECADGYIPGQNEANAHLIAAAPDLLAACVEARRYLNCHDHPDACYAVDSAVLKATTGKPI